MSDPLPTRAQWLRFAAGILSEAKVDSPRLSAELLLFHACAINRLELTLYPDVPLSPTEQAYLTSILQRRAAGEPAAYILGKKEFFGRDFKITSATLIPRPETELLVETALQAFPTKQPIHFADLGTGSGCIAISLCTERPCWAGIMADISPAALAVARHNAALHAVSNRLHSLLADFTKPMFLPESLDLIVSNPPYISDEEYAALSLEIRNYEPGIALVPGFRPENTGKVPPRPPTTNSIPNADGTQGLKYLLAVTAEAAIALRPGGLLLLEHGWTQSAPMQLSLKSHTWRKYIVIKDLAGYNRLLLIQKAL